MWHIARGIVRIAPTSSSDGNEIFNKKLFATRVLSGRTGRCHLVFYRPPFLGCLLSWVRMWKNESALYAAQSLTFGSRIFSLQIKMFDFLLWKEVAEGTYRNCHCCAFPMGPALVLPILKRKNVFVRSWNDKFSSKADANIYAQRFPKCTPRCTNKRKVLCIRIKRKETSLLFQEKKIVNLNFTML